MSGRDEIRIEDWLFVRVGSVWRIGGEYGAMASFVERRMCDEIIRLRVDAAAREAEVARWKDAAEKWQEFASHQEWCRYCGEDGVEQCDKGRPLRDSALAAQQTVEGT